MPTESMTSLMSRLNEQGYTDLCRAEEDGLHFINGHTVYPPEALSVDEVFRLEGTSAPDEQTVVFAVTSPDQAHKGTFCVGHGPDVDPLDADVMQRLDTKSEARIEPKAEDLHLQQQF